MQNYFVSEIDTKKATGTRNMIGKFVTAPRYILKVGYMFDHDNIHSDEYEAEYQKMLFDFLRSAGLDIDNISELRKKHLSDEFYKIFQVPRYKAAGTIMARKRKELGEDAKWRRFWFTDVIDHYPYREEEVFKIIETRRVLTGKWYGASSWKGWTDYGYEYDYEPGGLNPCYHHTVYEAKLFTKTNGGFRYYKDNILLHPNDIKIFVPDMPVLKD